MVSKNGSNFPFPKSTALALWLRSSAHEETELLLHPLNLVWPLPPRWPVECYGSDGASILSPGLNSSCSSTCSLGTLPSQQVNKPRLASWRMRDCMEERRSTPSEVILYQLTAGAWRIPVYYVWLRWQNWLVDPWTHCFKPLILEWLIHSVTQLHVSLEDVFRWD